MILLLTQMVFFRDVYVFLQLAGWAYLEQTEHFSTLETLICRKYTFQKLTQFLQGNNVLDAPACDTSGFLSRDTFLQLSQIAYLQPISTLKLLSCRKYSCQKLTQFSQGNNVLDVPASNADGFLSRGTCVSSTLWIGLFGTKSTYLHHEKRTLQEIFLTQSNLILTGKQFATCLCVYHRLFSLENYMCFFNLAE
jgi:hypothetical protein